MASGMEMLLKAAGINPDEIKAQVMAAQAQMQQTIANFSQHIGFIELALVRLETKVDHLLVLGGIDLDALNAQLGLKKPDAPTIATTTKEVGNA